MGGDFSERIDQLLAQVPDRVTSRVEVDQVYAKYQELRDDLKHPRGGKAHALRDAVMTQAEKLMQNAADHLITEDGSDIYAGAKGNAEQIARSYVENAPIEFGDLRGSAHPQVLEDGVVTYDRPPVVPRLTQAQLRRKSQTQTGFGEMLLGAGGVQ